MAMTKQDKANMIDELQAVLAESKIIYLANIDGLNAVNTTELRKACYKSNVSLRVVKNTLLKKAMEQVEDKNFEELYGSLKGNTALMTAEVGNAPAKVIDTFRKKSEKPILKGAWIEDNTFVGDDKLPQLVALKSREELIADIVMLLQSPIKTLVSQLENKDASKEEGASEE